MIRKTLSIVTALAAVATIAACSLTAEQKASVEKAYDTVCNAEPGIYQSFVLVAEAKQAEQETLDKAAAIHTSITGLCETRPTDIASVSVQVAALYARLITIAAQVEKSPALMPS